MDIQTALFINSKRSANFRLVNYAELNKFVQISPNEKIVLIGQKAAYIGPVKNFFRMGEEITIKKNDTIHTYCIPESAVEEAEQTILLYNN